MNSDMLCVISEYICYVRSKCVLAFTFFKHTSIVLHVSYKMCFNKNKMYTKNKMYSEFGITFEILYFSMS